MRLLLVTVVAAVLAVVWPSPGLAHAEPGPPPFDVTDPAIGRLDPALLSAIESAAVDAAADGVTMTITSGWRSPEFQQQLLDDAVQTYGSLPAARRFVQTPELSKHVVGQAVDVGGVGADQWLVANGSRYGLCRIYANEIWHFELATDALGACPPLLPDAASAPEKMAP
jgi:zinc D-Ala-D-Ala carboxypeptidase